MNDQTTLFDHVAALEARGLGIAQVSETRGQWLARVRAWALEYIDRNGSVTADDVRRAWTLPAGAHYNLWGAVFNDRRFDAFGDTRSAIVKGHGNRIRIWGRRDE